ncbi:MAG: DEAD/DEAH box helicase family protein [Lentisphaeria bacterium]|nr:DEAD/DEAH box helicase family protein [Lentisphaeria bacterium]
MRLLFQAGTLGFDGLPPGGPPEVLLPFVKADPRTGTFRARACDYAEIVISLCRAGIPFEDRAKDFSPVDDLELREKITLRPHQEKALAAWRNNSCRGVAALPTGSGKTILAVSAIALLKRPAFVMVPTIDLMTQWAGVLERFFGRGIGMLGGGSREIREITVSTYDSAVLNMEFIGGRFGFLVADECHHLPGPETRLAAAMSLAPFRLGLSATPDLPDDRAAVLEDLMGPVVCRVGIGELEGKVLSSYDVRQIRTALDPDEEAEYKRNRAVYTAFLKRWRISFSLPGGWNRFIGLAARTPGGREVFAAYLEQKRISRSGRAKMRVLWKILSGNPDERIIVFTADNATAYDIGRTFFLPVMTHLTKSAERKELLDGFRSGVCRIIVTSQVLNEGVDVPEASIGVVISGTASAREHVQRLGRILRPAPGKARAVLYELVSAGTSEESVSSRRRTPAF